jgi:hypothetical protein
MMTAGRHERSGEGRARPAVAGEQRFQEGDDLIAQITQPGVVMAILSALGLPVEAPTVHPARGPPELFDAGL